MYRPYLDSDLNTLKQNETNQPLGDSWDNLNTGWMFNDIEGLL